MEAGQLQAVAVACGYVGVVVADVIAVGVAFAPAGTGRDSDAALADAHSHAGIGTAVGAAVALGVLRGLQLAQRRAGGSLLGADGPAPARANTTDCAQRLARTPCGFGVADPALAMDVSARRALHSVSAGRAQGEGRKT